MENIKDCLRKKSTCVKALKTIYENNGEKLKTFLEGNLCCLLSHIQLCLY